MRNTLWQIRFRIKDRSLYGVGKSVLTNLNVTVPTEYVDGVLDDIKKQVLLWNGKVSTIAQTKGGEE